MNYCFYLDWKGMTASEWAAWAQAILSGIAILAAAWIATGQERRARRAKIDAYVEIIAYALKEAESTHQHLELSVGRSIATNMSNEWTLLCGFFDKIPFHEVPDYRLYSLVRDAARSSTNIRDIYEPLLQSEEKVKLIDVQLVRTEIFTLDQCHLEAAEISDKLVGFSLSKYLHRAWRQLTKFVSKVRSASSS